MEFAVFFSGKVHKWNKFGVKQERSLVVTNLNIYNFKKKKLRRAVEIKNLAGLTKSLVESNKEFVIHVKKEADFRMISDQ